MPNADLQTDPALQNQLQAGIFGIGMGGPVGCDKTCECSPSLLDYWSCFSSCLSGGDVSNFCVPGTNPGIVPPISGRDVIPKDLPPWIWIALGAVVLIALSPVLQKVV